MADEAVIGLERGIKKRTFVFTNHEIEHSYWEAQYEYVGAKDDDLNLAVGDVVTVVQQV